MFSESESAAIGHFLIEWIHVVRRQVHRLLMAAAENDDVAHLPSNKELQETCHHINIKHRVRLLLPVDLSRLHLI